MKVVTAESDMPYTLQWLWSIFTTQLYLNGHLRTFSSIDLIWKTFSFLDLWNGQYYGPEKQVLKHNFQ